MIETNHIKEQRRILSLYKIDQYQTEELLELNIIWQVIVTKDLPYALLQSIIYLTSNMMLGNNALAI